MEELQHAVYDAGRVDRLRLELLHDVEELVVDVRLLLELHLDLVEVREGVLDLELPVRRGRRRRRVGRGRRPTHARWRRPTHARRRRPTHARRRRPNREAAGQRALLRCDDGILRHHRARRAAGRAGRAGRRGDRRARPTRSASRRHRLLRHQGRCRGLYGRRRLYRCRRHRRRELGSYEPGRRSRDRRYDGCMRRWRGHHAGSGGRRNASWRC
mmetsp:Transcript_39093/g.126396  ORF Transcript_39093/g.126396 Transcript_39093/m.126396 type:complete len:214 (-) Transcript_39093:189-830(-)